MFFFYVHLLEFLVSWLSDQCKFLHILDSYFVNHITSVKYSVADFNFEIFFNLHIGLKAILTEDQGAILLVILPICQLSLILFSPQKGKFNTIFTTKG